MPYLSKAGQFECVVMPADKWFGQPEDVSKAPYIAIPLEVSEGPEMGCHATHYNSLATDNPDKDGDTSFDKTIKRLSKAFGWDGNLEDLRDGCPGFAGLACSITTEMEEYQGKPSCRIKYLNPQGGGGKGLRSPDQGVIDALFAKMGGRAKALAAEIAKKRGDTAPPRAAHAPAADATKDELPFGSAPLGAPLSVARRGADKETGLGDGP